MYVVFLCFYPLASMVPASSEPDILDIGSQRELFVDEYLIDDMDGLDLRLHHPRDEGPILKFDKPWEGPFCGYCTIIKDAQKYRFYYRGLPIAGKDGSSTEATCYADR